MECHGLRSARRSGNTVVVGGDKTYIGNYVVTFREHSGMRGGDPMRGRVLCNVE